MLAKNGDFKFAAAVQRFQRGQAGGACFGRAVIIRGHGVQILDCLPVGQMAGTGEGDAFFPAQAGEGMGIFLVQAHPVIDHLFELQ